MSFQFPDIPDQDQYINFLDTFVAYLVLQYQFWTTRGRSAPIIPCRGVVCLSVCLSLKVNNDIVLMLREVIVCYPTWTECTHWITSSHPPGLRAHPGVTLSWLHWFLPLCVILLSHPEPEHLLPIHCEPALVLFVCQCWKAVGCNSLLNRITVFCCYNM